MAAKKKKGKAQASNNWDEPEEDKSKKDEGAGDEGGEKAGGDTGAGASGDGDGDKKDDPRGRRSIVSLTST